MTFNNLYFANQIEDFQKNYNKHLEYYSELLESHAQYFGNFLNVSALKGIKDFKGYWVIELFEDCGKYHGELTRVSENDLNYFDLVKFDTLNNVPMCFVKKKI